MSAWTGNPMIGKVTLLTEAALASEGWKAKRAAYLDTLPAGCMGGKDCYCDVCTSAWWKRQQKVKGVA